MIDYVNMTSQTVSYEHLRMQLVKMPYKDFLSARYWKCISVFLRVSFKKCECGETEKLHVHHKTYKYVGIDHDHLNVLQVLCEDCHSIAHKKNPTLKSEDKGKGYVRGDEVKNTTPYNKKKKRMTWKKKCK